MTELQKILSKVDHTLLKPDCTLQKIKQLCDEAIEFKTASVCVPPCFVANAKDFLENSGVKVCTVVGFPNGYSTCASKTFEAYDALDNGAEEIDMVINVALLKSGRYDLVEEEIRSVREATRGFVLKVIIETCLLDREQKIRMCKIVTECGADYIKTSTGFSTAGATKEDIALFKEYLGSGVKIKAAGGIKSLKEAKEFIDAGCDRLGTSKVVAAAKAIKNADMII